MMRFLDYKISKHTRIITEKEKVLIYNSLLGTGFVANKKALKILECLKKYNCQSIDEIIITSELRKLYEALRKNFILLTDDNEEKINLQYSVKEIKKGAMLKLLSLNLASICNLRCAYCYQQSREYKCFRKIKFMPWDIAKITLKNFIDTLEKCNTSSATISFFGGEPVLN